MTLQMEVRVPDTTGENEVETELNAAIDEDPYWGEWEVGALTVMSVRRDNNDG